MSDEEQPQNMIKKCFNSLFKNKQTETVRETIEDLLEEASSNGEKAFSEREQLLLNNVLDLNDRTCDTAMVPRADIIAFHKKGAIKDLANLMIIEGHSRIPIYGESLDDIIGIMHVIDVTKALFNQQDETPVEEIVKKDVKIVSPSTKVLDLLTEMQSIKVHMAIVVDDYGGVAGLVTIEDLLEEIVGDIEDEYDFDEEHMINMQDKGLIVADTRVSLDHFKEITGIDLCGNENNCVDDIELDTLGGYIFHFAQRIPNVGEIIEDKKNIKFKILEVDPRRIKKVKIFPAK